MGPAGDCRGAALSGCAGADVSGVESRYFDRLLREKGEFNPFAPRVLNALLRLYNETDRVFDAVGLGRWFGTFVLTCGRKPAAAPA